MLEGQSLATQKARLQAVQAMITDLPPHIPVHLELAAFGDVALLRLVGEMVLPWVHSLGLNEQVMYDFTV